jgi:hypothetical protein
MSTSVSEKEFSRQIVLNVIPRKYDFFMELLKSLDFVRVEENNDGDSREKIVANIRQAAKDVELINAGKLQGRPARELLNEL